MIYAPVIIPTLNRFDHLKQCLESLNKNHNADKTEVFVSVDYPPSEKYKEGYYQICEYLDNNYFSFKELNVYKQTENLGVMAGGGKKVSNELFLTQIVSQKYDRWIVSEDDNVFAPDFLDFMNEALEKFKEDKTVFSVCGYRFFYNIRFKGNNFFRQNTDFNGWGCAFWKEKYEDIPRIEVDYLRKILYNPFKVWKIWKVSYLQVAHLSSFSRKANFKKGDNFLTLYMIDHGMTQIMPAKNLVKNIGWDESGLHCNGFEEEVISRHLTQEIDTTPTFEGLIGTGWECFKENEKVIREEDFQRCSFSYALKVYLKRVICFWK